MLGLSIFQSKPSYMIDLRQTIATDSAGNSLLNYQTLANFVTGIGLAYDKISFFAGFKTPGEVEQQLRKGKTRFSQFNLAITGIKLRIEASAKFYRGFYENNSANYIPGFNDSTSYFQSPDMKNNSFKVKAFYFLNNKKRFSYGAAYVNNVRQLKSAGSFLVSANVYTYSLKNDSTFIPSYINQYYLPWDDLNVFKATGISIGAGYTHTFTIFKRVFLNLLLSFGIEQQHLVFETADGINKYDKWKTALSAYDVRTSLGYNSKKFFLSFQTIIDGNAYETPQLEVANSFINAVFIIGYRFGVKPPRFYSKFQESGLYKML
jgi:hypothetical protein